MPNKALALRFGNRDEIFELSQRILDFLPGARDLPPEARLALAQIAVTHGLDPFTGEAWAIPQRNRNGEVVGFRLMIGIAGWRAHAHRSGEFCGSIFRDCTPEEKAALGANPGDLAAKCIITRRKTGQHPMTFEGFGLFRRNEATKMNPLQCVRLRAERDAMKAAFPLSLGLGMSSLASVADESGGVIDGEAVVTELGESVTYGTQAANGNGAQSTARPYSPDKLKALLAERAGKHDGRDASTAQRGLMVGALTQCFSGEGDAEGKRHAVQRFLFGIESANDMSGAQVLAALEWLKPTRESGGAYLPDSLAVKEAKAVIAEFALAEVVAN